MDDPQPRVEPAPDPAEDMRPQGGPAADHGPGHEISDVSVRGIFLFTAALAVFAVLFHVGFAVVMAGFGDRANRLESRRPPRYEDQRGQFPAPNLQESPNAEMVDLRREEQADVGGYHWVDRDARVARIPIGRAMDIVAEQHGWTTPPDVAPEARPKAARSKAARPKGAGATKEDGGATGATKKDEGATKEDGGATGATKKDEGATKEDGGATGATKKDEGTKKQEPESK